MNNKIDNISQKKKDNKKKNKNYFNYMMNTACVRPSFCKREKKEKKKRIPYKKFLNWVLFKNFKFFIIKYHLK